MKTYVIILSIFLAGITSTPSISQGYILQPVGLGEFMGEFSLTTLQGDQVSMSDFYGKKNVLLIIPRGKVLDDLWCPICFYQYAELAKWEKEKNIRKNHELEILFLMPYSRDSIIEWTHAANQGLETIEKWKNPAGYDTISGGAKLWADYMREFYPEKFHYKDGVMDTPIPILMDENKLVSRTLALYTKEWGGTSTDQNKPTIFLMDKNGKIQFKYHSQYTNDRPTAKYLGDILKFAL
jgi:peroxiredoxin